MRAAHILGMGLAVVLLATPVAAQTLFAQDPLQHEDAAQATATPVFESNEVVQEDPREAMIQRWSIEDTMALAAVIDAIGEEGLNPSDYRPDLLREEIARGEGRALDVRASGAFTWLVEDLRDGRTPMSARRQWHVVDPDADLLPTTDLMADVLEGGDIAEIVEILAPAHRDYAALREALATTPAEEIETRRLIRANMDRWRWLPRDLGGQYLNVNVPEFQLRLMVNGQVIRTYRTIVGSPGRTSTPQFAETVEGVIFNPTWTVPQSIVVGEGLGRRVLNNPNWARSRGYTATRSASGRINVVQQPGPNNALGLVKLDMPNPYAIFLHDTPAKNLFESDDRARSHGCIRVEGALEMAMTVVILGGGATRDEAVAISDSREYTRVPLERTIPVYVTYFTYGVDEDGNLREFDDLYSRDAPVLAALDAPRVRNR